MKALSTATRNAIEARDDHWVQTAREISKSIRRDSERQLRIIQAVAESSNSWKAVALFIRYQGARKQVDLDWVGVALKHLEGLRDEATSLGRGSQDDVDVIHRALVARVLGYAVRWHVWDIKGKAGGRT